MPTIHDCERCTQDCPQRQLVHEQSGKLENVVNSHWLWNKFSGEVRCKNCKSVVGVCFSQTTLIQLKNEQRYCYNCGSKMQEVEETYNELEP